MLARTTRNIHLFVIAAALAMGQTVSAQSPELDLAQKQMDANDLTAAATTLDVYLKAHPTNAAAWIKRGIVAALVSDDHAALADYDQAEKNGVPPAILTYRRAHCYMNLLNSEAALTQLELAVSNGVSLSTKLDDEVFDPIRSTPRFKAVLAQNDILHRCADSPHRLLESGAAQDLRLQTPDKLHSAPNKELLEPRPYA
jgi:tetratricopeptide (TPR) repeat protein